MKKISLFLLACCTVLNKPSETFSQDVRANAVKNPYSNAKVGDWVKRKYVIKYSDSSMPISTLDELETVKEKNEDRVVISNRLTFSDGDTTETERIVSLVEPFTILQSLGYKPPGFPIRISGKGVESFTFAGKDIDTEWQTYVLSGGLGGATSEQKIWRSDKIPLDGMVNRIHTSMDSVSTTTLVEFGFAGDDLRPHQASTTPAIKAAPIRSKWVNSIGISFMPIASGNFTMGQMNRSEFLLQSMELPMKQRLELLLQNPPKREVLIDRDFYAAAHEVTIGQFREFVTATGYKTDAEKDGVGGTGLKKDGTFGHSTEFTWRQYGFQVTDDHAVANVSWNDAKAFCKWLSQKESVQYRLLTEAEWEYCCRASTTTSYSTGDDPVTLKGHANIADAALRKVTPLLEWDLAFDDGFSYIAPVGRFKANSFGLYDMHGNLLEWCESEFDPFEPMPDVGAPKPKSTQYVVRGGHWFGEPERSTSSCRSGADPNHHMSLIGFRIATNGRQESENISKKENAKADLSQGTKVTPTKKDSGFPMKYRMTLLSDTQGRPTIATRITNAGVVLGLVNQVRKLPLFCKWNSEKQSMFALPENSLVADINNNGDWVATGTGETRDRSRVYVCRAGKITEISPTPSNGLHMIVAINSKGQCAGNAFAETGITTWIYEENTFKNLRGLGGNETSAFAINERGVVAGTATLATGEKHAFIAHGENSRDLGTIGGAESEALDINDHGVVVGISLVSNGDKRAFVWKDKVMTELTTPSILRARTGNSEALSLNNKGWIVGAEQIDQQEKRGIIWVDGNGYSLNDLVEQSDGWVIQMAGAINDSGQIAGTAYKNGLGSAVILTPISAAN